MKKTLIVLVLLAVAVPAVAKKNKKEKLNVNGVYICSNGKLGIPVEFKTAGGNLTVKDKTGKWQTMKKLGKNKFQLKLDKSIFTVKSNALVLMDTKGFKAECKKP